MSFADLMNNLQQQVAQNIGAGAPANITNFTKCPGLKRKRGKWWVPNGKNAADITYCDYCKNERGIQNCYIYPQGHLGNCNCDSYMLAKNAVKALFTVSLWDRLYEQHYPAKIVNGENVVELPSDTNFTFLIDSRLPDDQFFHVDVYVGDEKVQIHGLHERNVLFKRSVLVKGPSTKKSMQDFLFAAKGSMSDSQWEFIKNKISDEIEIKISVYKQVPANHLSDTGKFLGNFSYSTLQPGTYRVAPPKADDPEPANHLASRYSYSDSVGNNRIKSVVTLNYDYQLVNKKPIVIKVKLAAKGSTDEIDTANVALVKKIKNTQKNGLKRQIERTKNMLRALKTQNNENREKIELHETRLEELHLEMSMHLEPVSPATRVRKAAKNTADDSEDEDTFADTELSELLEQEFAAANDSDDEFEVTDIIIDEQEEDVD